MDRVRCIRSALIPYVNIMLHSESSIFLTGVDVEFRRAVHPYLHTCPDQQNDVMSTVRLPPVAAC